jgi:hypothetical protein
MESITLERAGSISTRQAGGRRGHPFSRRMPASDVRRHRDGRACIDRAHHDGEYMVPWTLKTGGRGMFSMPRAAVLRSLVMNHTIHHRGQLSVYLRLLDVPLPSIYGPTADTTF